MPQNHSVLHLQIAFNCKPFLFLSSNLYIATTSHVMMSLCTHSVASQWTRLKFSRFFWKQLWPYDQSNDKIRGWRVCIVRAQIFWGGQWLLCYWKKPDGLPLCFSVSFRDLWHFYWANYSPVVISMIFTSVSSLIKVGSGFPASLQGFGLLDAAEGAVYYVHNLRFLPSAPCPMEIGRFSYTEVNSPTGV